MCVCVCVCVWKKHKPNLERKSMIVNEYMLVHLLMCEEMKDPIEINSKCCQW